MSLESTAFHVYPSEGFRQQFEEEMGKALGCMKRGRTEAIKL